MLEYLNPRPRVMPVPLLRATRLPAVALATAALAFAAGCAAGRGDVPAPLRPPAGAVSSEARVYVNEVSGTYTITGDVWVMPGHADDVEIREPRLLKEWLQEVAAADGSRNVAKLILTLHRAQLLRGRLMPNVVPNILLLLADDLGSANLGCYGGKLIQTPVLDRLAAQGVRFTQAYAGCTVCAPSRCTLLTGFHAGHGSVRKNSGGVSLLPGDVTVAQVLASAGYACGGFGKWGLGEVGTPGVPERHGFDVFFGYYHQVHAHDYYTPYLWRNSERVDMPGAPGSPERYSHYRIVEETKRFIREHRDRPFFCYAAWTPPHGQYEIPESDPACALYKDRPWTPQEKAAAAMTSMVDRHVGELLALLAELGLDNRTLVMFSSDNGGPLGVGRTLGSNGRLRGGKGDLYEGGIRTPLIARWPGHVDPGTTNGHALYFPDVMPTLAEIAGAAGRVPAGIDGLSFVPALIGAERAGRPQPEHPFLYWEFGAGDAAGAQSGRFKQSVRQGPWKAVRPAPDAAVELYDLGHDPVEEQDAAASFPERTASMERIMKQEHAEPPPQKEPEKPAGQKHQ